MGGWVGGGLVGGGVVWWERVASASVARGALHSIYLCVKLVLSAVALDLSKNVHIFT